MGGGDHPDPLRSCPVVTQWLIRGLAVGLIGPDRPFPNNYGVWVDEFAGHWGSPPKKGLIGNSRFNRPLIVVKIFRFYT